MYGPVSQHWGKNEGCIIFAVQHSVQNGAKAQHAQRLMPGKRDGSLGAMLRDLHQNACAFGCTAVRALDAGAKAHL